MQKNLSWDTGSSQVVKKFPTFDEPDVQWYGSGVLSCDATLLGEWLRTFQCSTVPSSIRVHRSKKNSSSLLWKIRNISRSNAVPHPSRSVSTVPLWKPQHSLTIMSTRTLHLP
jgi:hypothetical protein